MKMLEAQTSLVCQLVPALLVSPWQSFHSPEVLLSFVTISARSLSAVRHTRHYHQLLCPGLRYGSCVRGDTKTKSHLIGSAWMWTWVYLYCRDMRSDISASARWLFGADFVLHAEPGCSSCLGVLLLREVFPFAH